MSQVVNINGKPIADPRTPNAEVIAMARRFLEMAEAGEIVGLQAIGICHDASTYSQFRGNVNWAMIGRLEEAKIDILEQLK